MPDGILIVDKPPDWTSMDVCAKLRSVYQERRVGHAGTLDPMATGVLPVFLGRATRAVSFAETGRKEYVTRLRLGLDTDTQDVTGRVLEEKQVRVNREDLLALLPRFTGTLSQIPPMYSAVKQNGKKLYELARQGKTVERNPREITIFDLELLEQCSDTDYTLRVVCSKGTYIRTLCHDIGAALGCGGCMAGLRRTAAAGYTLNQAVTLEEILKAGERGEEQALLLPVDSLFQEYPQIQISGRQEARCRNGNPFPSSGPEGLVRVYGLDGTFLMLGRREQGIVYTVKSFFRV